MGTRCRSSALNRHFAAKTRTRRAHSFGNLVTKRAMRKRFRMMAPPSLSGPHRKPHTLTHEETFHGYNPAHRQRHTEQHSQTNRQKQTDTRLTDAQTLQPPSPSPSPPCYFSFHACLSRLAFHRAAGHTENGSTTKTAPGWRCQ